MTLDDYRCQARRRLPRSVFDYIDGGADEELSLAANVSAFRAWQFRPVALADTSAVDLSADIVGKTALAPLGFSPTGYTRMISPLGEPAVAEAAALAGIPYVLSTMATVSLEQVAQHPRCEQLDRWFQLYAWKDRRITEELIDRAAAANYRVLELSVDTTVSGYRIRDQRNGFMIPPRLSVRTILDIAKRPSYWTKLVMSPSPEFANLRNAEPGSGYTIEKITTKFNPALTWQDLTWIRERWTGKLLLKGPIGPADAARAWAAGIDGIHLSNHGGRQLDRTIAPIDLVRPVRAAVAPECNIIVDSGIRHGADIATAIALGANAAFVGRGYLWGLAAAGREGVASVAQILIDQLRRTMQLLGVSSVCELRQRGTELVIRQ